MNQIHEENSNRLPGGRSKRDSETRGTADHNQHRSAILFQHERGGGLDGILEPLSLCADEESARRLIDFGIDPDVEARMKFLADRANQGDITVADRAEYEVLINAADFVAILRLKARRHPGNIAQ